MPLSKERLQQLEAYTGTNPIPADFDAFWDERIAEADAVPLEWEIKPSKISSFPTIDYLDLWFYGMGHARLYARFLRPHSDEPLGVVLRFHGYPGRTRSWLENSSFAGMGFADITMDNPGQGGRSEDVGGFVGTTVSGHLIAGLDGDPKDMYYVRLHQDIHILCRVLREIEGLDLSKVCVYGDSQGGGVGLATCALNPNLIARAGILYPFLSDFKEVWELGADEIAYEGLRYYSRWFDADGSQADAKFYQMGYIDTLSFAHKVCCPVLFGSGLADVVCPLETQFAVYNALAGPKKHLLYPDFGHEEIQAFDDELLTYFWKGEL